jgi:ABC-type lipoprotein export system ATPase subunit
MNLIQVNDVLPYFISDADTSASDIWRQTVSFRKGENYLISAASGTGKSSLLAYLFGERKDYKGDISFDEKKINSLNANAWYDIRKKNISFVFQGLKLFPELTVHENIVIKNRLTRFKSNKEINQLLEETGLAGKKNEKAARLSFGQQQRVAIVRALCQPFDFLFLDEPFSHLDEINIGILSDIVSRELHKRQAGLNLCTLGRDYLFDYQTRLKL